MFDSIAGDYDSLNHILSLDVDKIWRRRALKRIVDAPAPIRVLDLACGTGDFSIAIAKALSGPLSLSKRRFLGIKSFRQAQRPTHAVTEPVKVTGASVVGEPSRTTSSATGSHVTGVDLSEGMLAVMREKVGKAGLADMISIEEGDGEALDRQSVV